MEFSIERAEFLPAIQAVLNVVSARTTLPIISNVLLQLKNKELALYATDLDTSIRTKLTVAMAEEGAIALPAKKMAEIIREMPDATIKFHVDGKKVSMTCGKGKFQLTGVDSEDFPPFPKVSGGQTFILKQSTLAKMIHKTLFSTTKDETRPALQGVLWQIQGNAMTMVATDGHRLAKMTMPMNTPVDYSASIIVPAKTLNHLMRLFGEQDGEININVTENQVVFSLDGTTLYSRLIEGPYPDYNQVIPKSCDKKLNVELEALHAAVRSVSTLSNALTHQVKFDLSPGHVVLFASDRDMGGEARVELEAEYSGEDLQIGYNAGYLMEILRHMDSPKVVFELSSSVRAGLLRPSEGGLGEDYLCLIMPLRLTDEATE